MKKYIVEVYDDRTIWRNEEGQLHREDGPAVEYVDGSKAWWLNGKLHREDGPAVEYVDGSKAWYLNGQELTEQKFNEQTNPAKEMTIAELEEILGHKVKVVKENQ